MRSGDRLRVLVGVAWTLCAVGPVEAGRPLDTDDAAIIPRGACQIEAGGTRSAASGAPRTKELLLAPSCNPFGGGEVLLGLVRGGIGDVGASSVGVVQYKGLLRPVADGAPGVGFVVAYVDDLAAHDGARNDRAAYLAAVASAAVTPALQLDVNVTGFRRLGVADGSRRGFPGWRVAGEWTVSPRWTLVAEEVRTLASDHAYRAGLIVAVTPALALDASGGRRCAPACRATFYALGLTWVGGPWRRTSP